MNLKTSRNIVLMSGIAAVVVAAVVVALASRDQVSDTDAVTYIPKRILTLSTGEVAVPDGEATASCGESLESARNKASFTLLVPKVMLEGYSLKGAVAQAELVQLFYSDEEVCGDNAKTVRDGMIKVIATPLERADSSVKDGDEYATKQQKFFIESGIDASIYSFNNGMHAVGYPAGIGASKTIDENNTLIFEDNYDYPASVYVVDDGNGVAYRLEAFIPLEDLVSIGSSLG